RTSSSSKELTAQDEKLPVADPPGAPTRLNSLSIAAYIFCLVGTKGANSYLISNESAFNLSLKLKSLITCFSELIDFKLITAPKYRSSGFLLKNDVDLFFSCACSSPLKENDK